MAGEVAAALLISTLPIPADRVSTGVAAHYGSLFGVATGFDYQNRNFKSGDYESDRNFSHNYGLRNCWKTSDGTRINIPPLTTIRGQYYFGKDLMTMAGVGFSF